MCEDGKCGHYSKKNERGTTAIEYGIMASLIAVTITGLLIEVRPWLLKLFH